MNDRFSGIPHYIVSAADSLIYRCNTVDDEIANITGPNVGAVREAGQTHERVKLRGLCIDKHLAREARAELRYADAAGLSDDIVILRKSQNRRSCKYLHCIGV